MDDQHEDEDHGKSYLLEYSDFHGRATDDVDFFLKEFEALAKYNEQSTSEDKLRILPGLLKERALTWYKSRRPEETQDWSKLRQSLYEQFRRNPHKLLTKLSRIKKKPDQSIRRYAIKVSKLINQLQFVDELYPERVKVWWFLRGLPSSIRNYCLYGDNTTFEAAVATAKIYESTAEAPRDELTGRKPDNYDETSLSNDLSDVESCTSMGTFVSSVTEFPGPKVKKSASKGLLARHREESVPPPYKKSSPSPVKADLKSGKVVNTSSKDSRLPRKPPLAPQTNGRVSPVVTTSSLIPPRRSKS